MPEDRDSPEPDPQSLEPLGLDGFERPPADQGLSLDRLNQAFAEMLGAGHEPYAPPVENSGDSLITPKRSPLAPAVGAPGEVTPRGIIEALLFVGHPSNEPLSASRVAHQMRGVSTGEVDSIVRELNEEYAANHCPYAIVAEGEGYRLALNENYEALRQTFYGRNRQARLSQAALEVLALVAYRQPITSNEVAEARGRAVGALLTQLVRRHLVRLEREPEKPRLPKYRTTERFLQWFGLESLDELPRAQDAEPL